MQYSWPGLWGFNHCFILIHSGPLFRTFPKLIKFPLFKYILQFVCIAGMNESEMLTFVGEHLKYAKIGIESKQLVNKSFEFGFMLYNIPICLVTIVLNMAVMRRGYSGKKKRHWSTSWWCWTVLRTWVSPPWAHSSSPPTSGAWVSKFSATLTWCSHLLP